jgi:metal-responsive CopG/Arc/MetJ family transcriptional regulator
MAVYKVNVSLPRELVTEIDQVAAERGLSRSGFIAEASARYVADLKSLSAEELRKRKFDEALADMSERAKRIPQDVDYMKIIRGFRERDGWDGPE